MAKTKTVPMLTLDIRDVNDLFSGKDPITVKLEGQDVMIDLEALETSADLGALMKHRDFISRKITHIRRGLDEEDEAYDGDGEFDDEEIDDDDDDDDDEDEELDGPDDDKEFDYKARQA